MAVTLETPNLELLPDFADALQRDRSADNVRGKAAADEELERIAADPKGSVQSLENPTGAGFGMTGLAAQSACGGDQGAGRCRTGFPTATSDTRHRLGGGGGASPQRG